MLDGLGFYHVRQQPQHSTITTHEGQNELEQDMIAEKNSDKGSPYVGSASQEPPLYYAIESVPYDLDRGGSLLGRLQIMRLVSALMAGLTALFVFFFLRESLPGVPAASTMGALGVALMPLLGFMSGSVNPDSLLYAVCAAVFYLLARAFRRGLSTRGAVALGTAIAIGLLTKLNFVGVLPGVLLGILLLTIRARRAHGRSAYRLPAMALAIGLAPVVLYAAAKLLGGHSPFGVVSGALHPAHGFLAELNYIWQLYLPRIPGTVNDFPSLFPARQLWFNYSVGLYGWLDTTFPAWVYNAALLPAGAILVLFCRAAYKDRAALRHRVAELSVYAAMTLGLMGLVGAGSYRSFPEFNAEFSEPRYFLPLLALFGAVLAMAIRGAGKRWGPVVGTLLVVLILAHDIFSQLQVVARFYG